MEFFSTFGGSTVSCAAGLAVLDVVEEERLQAHAREVGERLLAALQAVARAPSAGRRRPRHRPLPRRRAGSDRETLEPAAQEAAAIVEPDARRGILLGTDGPFHNVLKIRPPMPFNDDDADFLVETLHSEMVNGGW